MSFNIKEKLFLLINSHSLLKKNKPYVYSIKIKTHLFLAFLSIGSFLSVIILFIKYFNNIKTFMDALSHMQALPIVILFVIFFSVILIGVVYYMIVLYESFLRRDNIFKYQKNKLNIEKELDREFGSVNKAISIYNELSGMNIEETDQNFYKILNETETFSKKREKILDMRDVRIKKIDERIQKLMRERDSIYSKGNERQHKLLDNLPEIEYKPADMSMDLSELKERTLV